MNETLRKIQKMIDGLDSGKPVIIAIDGNCTAGKTTLAGKLQEIYRCNVFHMDDFFLRPEQRTPERYGQVGGNVDYERFQTEVLTPLKTGESFAYRPFDCKRLTLQEPVAVSPRQLNIIEGTYSHHPYFGDPYDLKIFLSVTPELQHQRILQRPEFLQQRFFDLWIPLEQAYFDGFSIPEHSDLWIRNA